MMSVLCVCPCALFSFFQVPNSSILECTNFGDLEGKDFLQPGIDKTSDGKR